MRSTQRVSGIQTLDLDPAIGGSSSSTRGCNLVFPSGADPRAAGISYQGGALASGAAIQLIFWGSFWTDSATSPGTITEAIQTLVDSSYFFPLKQYNVDPGPLGRSLIVTSPAPPSTINSGDVTDLLWDLIGDQFPEPDEDGGHNIYVVFLPEGARGLPDSSSGAHSSTWRIDLDPLPEVHVAWYAWIGFSAGLAGITTSVSHEVVEAYTNPEPNGGWVAFPDPGESEIADLCNGSEGTLDGIGVVSYFSKFDNACVIPRGRSLRLFLAVKGIDGANGIRAHVPPGICLREFLTS